MEISIDSPTLMLGEKRLRIGASFVANGGVVTCLSGPSGCGKTSLLRALLGFVEITDGSIRIDGRELSEAGIWAVRRKTSYIPQELNPPVEWVSDMMRLPFTLHANRHIGTTEDKIFGIWEELGLTKELSRLRVRELSGGQRSRIALASAIAMQKPLILADEPTAALDSDSSQRVSATLQKHCEETGSTVIVVSHDTDIWSEANKIRIPVD